MAGRPGFRVRAGWQRPAADLLRAFDQAASSQVADAMSSHWVNFAKSGNPNGKGLDQWPLFDGKSQSVKVFGNPPEGTQAPSAAQLAFFQSYFDKLTAQ